MENGEGGHPMTAHEALTVSALGVLVHELTDSTEQAVGLLVAIAIVSVIVVLCSLAAEALRVALKAWLQR